MHVTVSFDILSSSDWRDEAFSIEVDTVENAHIQAIQMANSFELAYHIQRLAIIFPDGEQHYCYSWQHEPHDLPKNFAARFRGVGNHSCQQP